MGINTVKQRRKSLLEAVLASIQAGTQSEEDDSGDMPEERRSVKGKGK